MRAHVYIYLYVLHIFILDPTFIKVLFHEQFDHDITVEINVNVEINFQPRFVDVANKS